MPAEKQSPKILKPQDIGENAADFLMGLAFLAVLLFVVRYLVIWFLGIKNLAAKIEKMQKSLESLSAPAATAALTR